MRPFDPADWPAVRAMDVRAFGASRINLLQRLAQEAPEYAWVLDDTAVRGYLFGRHGYNREQLGPLVADSSACAAALVETCLAEHPDRSFFIDVPEDQRAWMQDVSDLGFEVERPFLRMHRGVLTAPGEPSAIYAITGPEFG